MQCVHTGALVWLEEYESAVRCDVHASNIAIVLRTTGDTDYSETASPDWSIKKIDRWFDESKIYGTLIAGQIKPLSDEANREERLGCLLPEQVAS